MTDGSQKRRQFRIDDTIGVSFRKLMTQKPELKLADSRISTDMALKALNTEFNTLINTIWVDDPKVAKVIAVLNKKLDTVIEDLDLSSDATMLQDADFSREAIKVNVSGCGIKFAGNVALESNDRIEIVLTLSPSNTRVSRVGRVLRINELPNPEDPYEYVVDFEPDDQAEEQLIQHILQRQVQLLSTDKDKQDH